VPWIQPRRATDNRTIVAVVAFALFFGLVVVGVVFPTEWFVLLPICGFMLIFIVLGLYLAMGGFRRSPLPPPPPIQQPMVPAGRQPPIAINCPNCGAPPGMVDRFGVAICAHCNTRFIVR
jgi:hypothetical protein